jgi:hypothetical protein
VALACLVAAVVAHQHLLNTAVACLEVAQAVAAVAVAVVACVLQALAQLPVLVERAGTTFLSLAAQAEQPGTRPPLAGMVVRVLVVAAAVRLRRQV